MLEALMLIDGANGYADKEIARRHSLSKRTVETHLINLRGKLNGDSLAPLLECLRHLPNIIDTL
jgi:DNA-binding NarL/FixJ family response regulator